MTKKKTNYYARKINPSMPNYKHSESHYHDWKKALKHVKNGGVIEKELADGTRKQVKKINPKS